MGVVLMVACSRVYLYGVLEVRNQDALTNTYREKRRRRKRCKTVRG